MSIVWEDPGAHAPDDRPQRPGLHGLVGTVLLLVLFGAAAMALAAATWRGEGAPAAQPAAAPQAAEPPGGPAEPVAPTAARIASPPTMPPEQPLPEGSARFALDGPAPAAMAKNWRPAGTGGPGVDSAATASIPARAVAVAETEDEVVAMETELAAAGSGAFEIPAAADLAAGRTLKWVNMRAGPGNDTEVLTVVPYDAEIRAERDCDHWCAVTWQGRPGYIYRSFIGYDG